MKLLPKDQDWTAYTYLVYLIYFLLYPFLAGSPAWQANAALAATAVSVLFYFWSYWLHGLNVLWIAAGWFALAAFFLNINMGASVFFVYAACLYGKVWEPPAAFRALALHLALVTLLCAVLHANVLMWISSMVFSALVGAVVIQFAQRKRLADRLAEAHEQTEHLAKVAERERIARDLHDLLGHTLSLIVLKSELASRLSTTQPERAAEEIRDVERISREALAQVRAAVRGYRSMGLEGELKQARATLETAGIAVESSLETPRLSPMQESVFALALREAVTNVVRHAQATCCRLSLRRNGAFCELEVADNGRGGGAEDGSGLSGMRERVEALGGILERDGSRGTLLRIRVPV
uniref:Integral membrane sensor signal transduction histidine kinase n=1 Tax=Solibacter usitatus (strain Ellin6076) TaxID=234267 RepID=Q029K9_SOLUE